MSLTHLVTRRAAGQRLSDLRALAREPQRAQAWTLERILARARRTRFGREHRLREVRSGSYEAFRRAVPLRRPVALEPWWRRARRGEQDAVWPGRVVRSISLGRGPVPLTADGLRSARASGWDAFAPFLAGAQRDLSQGSILLLGEVRSLPRGAALWTSGGAHPSALHLPASLRRRSLQTPCPKGDGDVHRARACFGHDVRVLLGTPAQVDRFAADLLAHGRRLGLGYRSLADVWPDLEILDVGPELRRPVQRVDGGAARTVRRQVLSVLELGAVAVQDRLDEPGLLPIPDRGVFFEFVPRGEEDASHPRRLALHEVASDTEYAVAVTTNNGTYACLTGYVVRFPDARTRRLVVVERPAETRRGDLPGRLRLRDAV
jgi:hypothetical protein